MRKKKYCRFECECEWKSLAGGGKGVKEKGGGVEGRKNGEIKEGERENRIE